MWCTCGYSVLFIAFLLLNIFEKVSKSEAKARDFEVHNSKLNCESKASETEFKACEDTCKSGLCTEVNKRLRYEKKRAGQNRAAEKNNNRRKFRQPLTVRPKIELESSTNTPTTSQTALLNKTFEPPHNVTIESETLTLEPTQKSEENESKLYEVLQNIPIKIEAGTVEPTISPSPQKSEENTSKIYEALQYVSFESETGTVTTTNRPPLETTQNIEIVSSIIMPPEEFFKQFEDDQCDDDDLQNIQQLEFLIVNGAGKC